MEYDALSCCQNIGLQHLECIYTELGHKLNKNVLALYGQHGVMCPKFFQSLKILINSHITAIATLLPHLCLLLYCSLVVTLFKFVCTVGGTDEANGATAPG